MKSGKFNKSTWGLVIFSIGVILGVLFSGASVWGNLEAFLFDPTMPADETFRNLKCPPVITTSETGTVSLAFTNPSDRSVMTTVRTHISDGLFLLMRELEDRIQLEPGETKQLEWTVTPEDAAWERFILVRVYSLRSLPLPSRTGTCGIILVDLPFLTGNQVVTLLTITSFFTLGAGLWLWVSSHQPLSRRNRYAAHIMGVLAALVLIGIILAIFRLWLVGAILFFFTVLLIIVVITYFLLASENGGA